MVPASSAETLLTHAWACDPDIIYRELKSQKMGVDIEVITPGDGLLLALVYSDCILFLSLQAQPIPRKAKRQQCTTQVQFADLLCLEVVLIVFTTLWEIPFVESVSPLYTMCSTFGRQNQIYRSTTVIDVI